MKKIILVLIIPLFLTGCFNYTDVNRVVFVTSLGIDIDKDNKVIVYAETFTSLRGENVPAGKDSRLVLEGKGKTIFEAIRYLSSSSSLKLNYTQNKAIIFSERAAKYGLDNFLDTLTRDQELLVRQYLYISSLDLEKLMKMGLKEERFIGIFLSELTQNRPYITKTPQIRIDEFIISRKLGDKINTISVIEKSPDSIVDRIFINKLAVMDDAKMIGILDYDESFYYNIGIDALKTGFIEAQNPNEKNKIINLEILNSKAKKYIKLNQNIIDVEMDIKIKTTFAHSEKTIHLENKDIRQKIIEYAEENIKEGCTSLYNKYKNMDIDIFNLERHIDAKYPNADVDDNILNNINLVINVDVTLEGSSNRIEFY